MTAHQDNLCAQSCLAVHRDSVCGQSSRIAFKDKEEGEKMVIVSTMCKLLVAMLIGFFLFRKEILTEEINKKLSALIVQVESMKVEES